MAKIQITPDSSRTIRPGSSFTPAPSPIPPNNFVDKYPDAPIPTEPPAIPKDPQAQPTPASGDRHVVDPVPPPVQPLVP